MDDPWDVKSVRQAGQYVSCMKLNGTPLLPPVLSKECRAEMQYYKILAKEVEKRISLLPLRKDINSDEDKTDSPELLEKEQTFHINIKDIPCTKAPNTDNMVPDYKVTNNNIENYMNTTKVVIDVSLNVNQNAQNITLHPELVNNKTQIELPEKDCSCSPKDCHMLVQDATNNMTYSKNNENAATESLLNFNITTELYDKTSFTDIDVHDEPSSLSSRSFTGSLRDIHTEAMNDTQNRPQLIRQRSYTVLKPSPQLLAHLEVHSQNTGIEMQSISMSESMSNLSLSPNKKRRSWDLETAKFKWSSMALDLKKHGVPKIAKKTQVAKPTAANHVDVLNGRPKSVGPDKGCRGSFSSKTNRKSEPIQGTVAKKPTHQVQNSSRTVNNMAASPNQSTLKNSPVSSSPKPQVEIRKLISESDDPATKVRELYERIQAQQMMQMASLVEKQKREQQLLQQAFEEQNSLLYKQLKTICPESPNEIKQAWTESPEPDRDGPVSLSQLINQKSPDTQTNPIATTLTDTNHYIHHCDDVLKRSRVLTDSLKKHKIMSPKPVQNRSISPMRSPSVGSRTRTHSPVNGKSSTPRRQIQYDTSQSDRDYEPVLTDRTNDTMADLNVTFPTDESAICDPFLTNDTTIMKQFCKDVTVLHRPGVSMEQALRSSNECHGSRQLTSNRFPPTEEELAAASRIVAYARGYLVRRLMSTERVQTTVQLIRDALLCALQLHQDREGIRGADVDLHRRLIQQITAACYSLHDTFVASAPADRCALIAADRQRRRSVAARQTPPPYPRQRYSLDDYDKLFGPLVNDPESAFKIVVPSPDCFRDVNSNSAMLILTNEELITFCELAEREDIESSYNMYRERFLVSCRLAVKDGDYYLTAVCASEMRKNVSYNVTIKAKDHMILEAQCECAAGAGPYGQCKHIIVLIYGVIDFNQSKSMKLKTSSTSSLQTFHHPRASYSGNPVKVEDLKLKFKDERMKSMTKFDPRPFVEDAEEYQDNFKRLISNYCGGKGDMPSIPIAQMIKPADKKSVYGDHDYLEKTAEERYFDSLKLTKEELHYLNTKTQRNKKKWSQERRFRLQSSDFGKICKQKTNQLKLAKSLVKSNNLQTPAIKHGRKFELVAIKMFENITGSSVTKCGIIAHPKDQFLGSTPDALVGNDAVLEVKCPYTARNEKITVESVPYLYLCEKSGTLKLKSTHDYYYQIQGQMFCSQRNMGYLFIYTMCDHYIMKIEKDEEFINKMCDKLLYFYNSYYKQVLLERFLYN